MIGIVLYCLLPRTTESVSVGLNNDVVYFLPRPRSTYGTFLKFPLKIIESVWKAI